jgi:hypothetical protein
MAMKEYSSNVFGKVVCEVDRCVNASKFEEILFDYIHMSCAGCRLLGHGHCNTYIIVFIKN